MSKTDQFKAVEQVPILTFLRTLKWIDGQPLFDVIEPIGVAFSNPSTPPNPTGRLQNTISSSRLAEKSVGRPPTCCSPRCTVCSHGKLLWATTV